MKKILFTLTLLIGISLVSFSQHNKEHIENIVYDFGGEVTEESLNIFIDSLIANSIENDNVCFISLFASNKCDMIAADVFKLVQIGLLNDLVGEYIVVKIDRERQPWKEDDFYMYEFSFTSKNTTKFLALDINYGNIRNVYFWEDKTVGLSN
tara:strand:- start:1335 stop:1790 length:456 start_codon:yes stop_codon:yes gene_type:complete